MAELEKDLTRDERVKRADDSVSHSFTRIMRAATSPIGVLTDPPLVALAEGVIVIIAVTLYNVGVLAKAQLWVVYLVLALPVLAAIGVDMRLRSARAQVVQWLASVPFP
ncbi:MAG TPA: hypothetical protein VFB62_18510, partial [Polyangiaceae bacterium]|nr:hypothetical protein [Polyangiaceae bacterium]